MKQAMQATPDQELYEYLMDLSIPKSEAEHYAAKRISELEALRDRLTEQIEGEIELQGQIAKLRAKLIERGACPKCNATIVVDYRAGKATNHRCSCGWTKAAIGEVDE